MTNRIVIIPTYNEKENIENIIRAVFSLEEDFHVLIIDDGSPDGTAAIVKQLCKEFVGQLFIEERKGKLGLGTAYIHGFKWALDKGTYDYICEMDADFSHNPKDLPRLCAAAAPQGVGMSIGSRYMKGGKLVNWPMSRIMMSKGASIYVRLITWMPVTDATAGFVCYTKEFLEQLDFEQIQFVGYAFQIEMKFACWQLGFELKDIPITFTDRVLGASKMSSAIFSEAFWGVLKMRWKGFFKNYRTQA